VSLLIPALTVRYLLGQSTDTSSGQDGPARAIFSGEATGPGRTVEPASRTVKPESRWVSVGPETPQVVAYVREQLVGQAVKTLGKHSQPRRQASNVHVPEEVGFILSRGHQGDHGVVQVQG